MMSCLFGLSFLREETGWVPGWVCVHEDMTCLYHHNIQKDRLELKYVIRKKTHTYLWSVDTHMHVEILYINAHTLDPLTGTV